MMRKLVWLFIVITLFACSLKPLRVVTRADLSKHRLFQRYVIEESPEQVLDALNTYGEAVLTTRMNIPNRNLPVHVKILATSDGLEVMEYDR
ncbi:MAG: hypothetical protein P1P74_00185 [Desulfuromonadales bacterium]|nr:hypothetical protein [Desulfuromonadales bacterium]MDT8423847.1 hypothetical protein [Desulfuromonadales bacterium]